MPGHKSKKSKLLIKTLGQLPGTIITGAKEKMMSMGKKKKTGPMIEYKMHGGKVHYKPGGGMVMDDMNKVMMKMHGGKVHDAKYYQKGAKVAGCGPARNNPMKKKA